MTRTLHRHVEGGGFTRDLTRGDVNDEGEVIYAAVTARADTGAIVRQNVAIRINDRLSIRTIVAG